MTGFLLSKSGALLIRDIFGNILGKRTMKNRKKIEQNLAFLSLPVDIVMVLASFIVAYVARSIETDSIPVIYIWPFEKYFKLALLLLPIWILAFSFAGLYNSRRQRAFELGQIIVGSSLGAMALVFYVFLQRGDFFSRIIVLYVWVIAIIFVAIGRGIINLIKNNLHLIKSNKMNVAVIGRDDVTTRELIEQIQFRPALGYKLAGVISLNGEAKLDGVKYLGKSQYLNEIIKHEDIDEIILTDTEISDDKMFNILQICQENDVLFKAVPAYAQVGIRTLQFDEFAGIPMIEFQGTALQGWGIALKRLVDIILSLIAIVLLSPAYLILSLIIKLTSKGPVIYRNVRVGNKGNFETLKFRTMYINYCTGENYGGSRAEEFENKLIKNKNIKKDSVVYKIAEDPRVTPIGNFLRKSSLDELPQFFNVLLGNMSIVGPRPHQPKEVKNYTPEQRKLLLIKPGITGLAQISGRSDLSFNEEARLDTFYLENWSIWFDFYIMLKTISTVIVGKGGY